MGLLILQLVNGITYGMFYGLAALGLSMVFKALGYMNFAHSDTIMIGAILLFCFMSYFSIPYWAAFLLTLFITMLYGAFPHGLDFKFTDASFEIAGTRISLNNFVIFVIIILILVILQLFFVKTRFGLAIRMAQESPETAAAMGVNVLATRAATFAISAGLGCVSGMLIGPMYTISAELGAQVSLKAFIAAVIGGLGNFVGAIFGGVLVGIVECLGATYISSGYKDIIVYTAGIVVLGFFPYGIFRRVKTKH